MDAPAGTYPLNLEMYNVTVACQHCENPACAKVCPVGATYKDPETGMVRQDYDKCIGCRMCMAACPYTGVRSFNWEEPAYHVDFARGRCRCPPSIRSTWWRSARSAASALPSGEQPACVDVCSARARHLRRPATIPNSEVSKLIGESSSTRSCCAERGTKPSVYYLV